MDFMASLLPSGGRISPRFHNNHTNFQLMPILSFSSALCRQNNNLKIFSMNSSLMDFLVDPNSLHFSR